MTDVPLITVASLKTGKESFNFLELELSKEYYLAIEKLLENVDEYIYMKYIHNMIEWKSILQHSIKV